MTTYPEIRPARDEEIPAVGHLISHSFFELDANAYLVPPLDDRLKVMADFFTLLTEHAQKYGRVDVIDLPGGGGLAATAVWFDYTRDAPDPEAYEERLNALAGEYIDRFVALDLLFEKHHPHDPHWHLAFLAVHPDHQEHGLGSKLMARTHSELDKSGVPAYLEATNHNNVRLYHRVGYADMDPFEMLLPDGTPFYRMWRA
ncbi:GCN5-like N-acetyltransferase [Paractinoplanes abujensis]|uniref:Ribosomal protein S18 acetylase RimI-like enzyme n=1 Tax=Paractinoplanes abujensis TaxID=882441 RepID=A0A7W7FZB9_9ACTN|nr:GNAT family N-acetyltransferase [Actinoplanes abujensis]MBB4690444.1 ribosomal protein S18 acetylase RimI-like enzyme [Actinoplanes abujensis]GID21208.1 GCN5-like N-acetyltransferase [Actinoplanes abujensis]